MTNANICYLITTNWDLAQYHFVDFIIIFTNLSMIMQHAMTSKGQNKYHI